jgi:double-strand break repair protein MRE11
MNFHVMQPGSSVATSLMPGEAVPKHVSILKVTGRDYKHEAVLLKTVRPFLMKEIVLAEERALKNIWKKDNNRTEITRHLVSIVDDLIEEAKQQWRDAQDPDMEIDDKDIPLPLIRLRVEYTAPDGGRFDCENPQRFSNRFAEKVANINDVVQFHRKKTAQRRRAADDPELPEDSVMEQLSLDSVKVEKLVREFLAAQSLGILPQAQFGEMVGEFVDKDDKHSMEMFVTQKLSEAIKSMYGDENVDDDNVEEALPTAKSYLERLHEQGLGKTRKNRTLKPKPDTWDSDLDGEWADQPAALIHSESEGEAEVDEEEAPVRGSTARGRGRGRGAKAATATTRKTTVATKKAAPPSAPRGRGKKKIVEEEDEDESDVQMVTIEDDDEEEEEEDNIFVKPTKTAAKKPAAKVTTRQTASPIKKPAPARRAPAAVKQSTLNFSQSTQRTTQPSRASKPIEIVSCMTRKL